MFVFLQIWEIATVRVCVCEVCVSVFGLCACGDVVRDVVRGVVRDVVRVCDSVFGCVCMC